MSFVSTKKFRTYVRNVSLRVRHFVQLVAITHPNARVILSGDDDDLRATITCHESDAAKINEYLTNFKLNSAAAKVEIRVDCT